MLKRLGSAALKDIIGMLHQEPTFFTHTEAERQKLLHSSLRELPEVFTTYLLKVSEAEFLSDMKYALDTLNGFYGTAKGGLLEALSRYIAHDLGLALDELTLDFFFLDYSQRVAHLQKLFPGMTAIHQASVELFAHSTYQELTQEAYLVLETLSDIPSIVLQAPLELSSAQRLDIRRYFLKKYPHAFPEFQINPQIIGGMRVLVDGEVVDHSWMAKIQALTSL